MIHIPGRYPILIFLFNALLACINAQPTTEKGYYLSIRNFSPKEYKSRPQNWAVTEDQRGVLYFGNNEGILEYDGVFWNKINANEQIVRSLAVDENGIIYAGCDHEFGFVKPDENGTMIYHSLLGQLNDSLKNFESVENVSVTASATYFQAYKYLFRWDGDEVQTWIPGSEFISAFYARGIYFVQERDQGLLFMQNDSLKPIPGGEKFANSLIAGMIPFLENDILIVTEMDGIFHLVTEDAPSIRKMVRHFNEIDNFLFENSINCAVRINENQFAVGSEGRGVIIYDQSNDQFDFINFTSGLQDEVVTDIHLDQRGNLWMALSNGISMSPAGSSVTTFGYNAGIKESVEGISRYQNRLFVATMLGTYYLDDYQTNPDLPDIVYNHLYNRPGFRKIDGIDDACYGDDCFSLGDESFLLVATAENISQIDRNLEVSEVVECAPWKVFQSRKYPQRVLIANYNGISSVFRENGQWVDESYVDNIDDNCRMVLEDIEGDVWVGTIEIGVIYRIRYQAPGSDMDPVVSRYDSSHNIPEGDVFIEQFNDELLFGTVSGLYRFDRDRELFYPDTTFGPEFSTRQREIHRISVDTRGRLWLVTYKNESEEYETGYFEPTVSGGVNWVREPFLSFSKGVIHALFHDPDGVSWLGGPDGLFRFDSRIVKDYRQDYYALIRRVMVHGDSMIFNGTHLNNEGFPDLKQNENSIPVIRFKDNSITFEYAAPSNEDGSHVLFSHYLEGFDDGWNDWSPETRREFTNLHERNYIFHLKARNLYDHESTEATFSFTIKPPWYRTLPALITFILLGIGTVWLIVVLYTRGLRAIIRERTAEIREQKDLIEEKNQDIMASITYAQRIQSALLPPGDYIDGLFPERFIFYLPRDIVSGDFYWIVGKNEKIICVTADCTGHGVPGAMMSMMGMSYLNEITSREGDIHSEEILNQLRSQIVKSLRQKGISGETPDGMDMALYILDTKSHELEFSGANLPLFLFREGELQITPPDKMPIGISSKLNQSFTRHTIKLRKGDVLYTFSDGFQDQFGGPNNKKFMIKKFRNLLCDIHQSPMEEQKKLLNKSLKEWMLSCEQVDDITVLGVKV